MSGITKKIQGKPWEMRGGRKPTASPVAIEAFTVRKISLMAVVLAGNPAVPARRRRFELRTSHPAPGERECRGRQSGAAWAEVGCLAPRDRRGALSWM
jgi:hypothetical protein